MGDRTIKNDPANRYGEDHFELEKALRPVWQGWMFWNQTFDRDVECNTDEIRALFEDEAEEDLNEEQFS